MTPEQITAGLADCLRRKGVGFRTADLEVFAAGVSRQPEDGLDVDALAAWFMRASRVYAHEARGRRIGWIACLVGAILLGFSGASFVALCDDAVAYGIPVLPVWWILVAELGMALGIGGASGLVLQALRRRLRGGRG